MMSDKWLRAREVVVLAVLFLLPWQTRWIFATPTLNGGPWEYGVGSIYAVELLIVVALFLSDRAKLMDTMKRIRLSLILFFSALILSAIFGVDPAVSFAALIHIFFAILLALILVISETSWTQKAGAFITGLIPVGLLGWFQTLSGTSPAFKWLGLASHLAVTPGVVVVETPAGRLLRAYGSFSHPNIFGGYLALGLVLCLLIQPSLSKRGQTLNAIAAAFLGATLIITFSRSAFLALLIGLVMIIYVQRRRLKKNLAFFGLMVGLLVTSVCFHTALLTRASTTDRLEQQSIDQRVSQYSEFIAVAARSPWLGTGTSAYTRSLADVFPTRASWDLQPIHNAFFLFLAEQGILGVIAFSIGLWLLIRRSRLHPTPYTLLPFLPLALVDHYLWSSWSGLALLAVFGVFCTLDSSIWIAQDT